MRRFCTSRLRTTPPPPPSSVPALSTAGVFPLPTSWPPFWMLIRPPLLERTETGPSSVRIELPPSSVSLMDKVPSFRSLAPIATLLPRTSKFFRTVTVQLRSSESAKKGLLSMVNVSMTSVPPEMLPPFLRWSSSTFTSPVTVACCPSSVALSFSPGVFPAGTSLPP